MTESADLRTRGLRRGPIEPLSPQAWQRVETAVFHHLPAVPWSLAPAPLYTHAAPRAARPLRLHWAVTAGLAFASAAAAASAAHYLRRPPALEAGLPAELALDAPAPVIREPAAPSLTRVVTAPLLAERPEPASTAADSMAAEASLAAPSSERGAHAAPLARPSRRVPVERPPARSDRERLFERAASLEAADAPLALALYLSLASGDDAWGANALYAAARLEIERGLHDEGNAHLREYMERFPAGENAADVRVLRRHSGSEP